MSQTPLLPDRTIVLVGLMGAGKSSIGRRLAHRLGVPFVDSDTEVEAAAGCSVQEIFERLGEPAFRQGERRVIKRLLEGPAGVMATGGGAFMDAETRALIRAKGLSVWLRADIDMLVQRTARNRSRPLLRDRDPREVLTRLMEERYPIYAEADVIVDSDDGPPERTVDRVVAAVERHIAETAQRSQAAGEPAETSTLAGYLNPIKGIAT